jgi:hypothetical protein
MVELIFVDVVFNTLFVIIMRISVTLFSGCLHTHTLLTH